MQKSCQNSLHKDIGFTEPGSASGADPYGPVRFGRNAMLIEIDMKDACRGLGAGRRIVRYIGFTGDHLVCEDSLGKRVRLPKRLFTFRQVHGYETQIAPDGSVLIRVDGRWQNLGPLFSGCVGARG